MLLGMISGLINEAQDFYYAGMVFSMLLFGGSVESCMFTKGFGKSMLRHESWQSTVVVNVVLDFQLAVQLHATKTNLQDVV